MTIMDATLEMFDGQSLVAATAGTTISSDVVDLGAASPNPSIGNPVYLHCRIGTACTGGTSTTLAIAVQHSADNSSYSNLVTYSAASIANFTEGLKVIEAVVPATCSRYVKTVCTIAASDCNTGTIDCWIDSAQTETV